MSKFKLFMHAKRAFWRHARRQSQDAAGQFNLSGVRAEERVALAVLRPASLIKGDMEVFTG